jgi:uncharacterized protein (UPF0248 family)
MVPDILDRLSSDELNFTEIFFYENGTKKTVYGRDIVRFDRSHLVFIGGESIYEEFTIPTEKVIEIKVDGRTVFKKKSRIERVYPRF